MKPKKVLVIINRLEIGGAEKDIVRNFPLLNKMQDFEISILTYEQPGALAAICQQAGLSILVPPSSFMLKILRRIPLLKNMLMIMQIQQMIQRIKPDIIHVFLVRPYLYTAFGYAIARFFKGKQPALIMSRLNLNYHHKKHPLLAKFEIKFCHPLCTKIVANSKAIMRDLTAEAVPTDKQYLLYNGIDTAQFTVNRTLASYQKNEFTLTAIGNLHSYKGYADLLMAVHLLRQENPDCAFKLLIAGRDEANNFATYQQFLATHKLEKQVQFLGHCDDIITLLKQSDLHIHPSHTEGLPNAVIEAMSAELPIIATNIGGIPELIDEGKTGLLIAPHAPETLAQAMINMLSNPQKMYGYGQAGKIKANKLFNIQQSVQSYQTLYATIT